MTTSGVALLRKRVDLALTAFLADQGAELAAIGADLDAVSLNITEFLLTGGKRVRPAFAYWGAVGAGLADSDELVAGVSSLELLQACALIHDDVMDGSDIRRHRPAVHRAFASLHREWGYVGDPDTFGSAAAILLGDLCLIWGDRMLDTCGLDHEALIRARPVHDVMRSEVMAGQYLDLVEQARGGGDVASALRVARFKSAKYTIERPLHLGAAFADADESVVASYSAYGLPLGEAFQLRDDVLGVFGDPAETGKPAGDDLREGKRTVLIAVATRNADAAQRRQLERHVGDPHLDADGVATLREVLRDTGALAAAERLIDDLTQAALAALNGAVVTDDARNALIDLAVAATSRRV